MNSPWSRLLDRAYIAHTFFLVLFLTLLPIGEVFLFLQVADRYDTFLMLGAAASTGLVGGLIYLGIILRLQKRVRRRIAEGEIPLGPFRQLVGAVVGAVLIVLPGFISDALAVVLLLPVMQRLAGRIFFRNAEERVKELYTWAKLY